MLIMMAPELQSLKGYGRNSNVKKEKVGLPKFQKIR